MTSRPRSGPGSHRQRSREFDYNLPPLSPAGTGTSPSLRTLNSPRDRDTPTSSTVPPSSRPRLGSWSAMARRAERIRSLDERIPAPIDDSADQMWHPSTRRSGRMRSSAEAHSSTDLDDIRSLDEANSHLRALLDLTSSTRLSPILHSTSSTPPPIRSHDYSDDNRRNKRRKLDAHRYGTGSRCFRYGKYGQVEAGQLRMELVSCDGGIFSNEAAYAAENILQNDGSVYCTKGNRCNVVLRHQGGTVFTVKELVIKAPARTNYSHPVREGMVFIAMDQDETLNRTAQYRIQYGRPRRNRSAEGNDSLSRHVISIRHHDDGSTTTTRSRRSFVYRADEDDDNRVPQMPQEFAVNLPDFHVTTECSDDEEDDNTYVNGSRPIRGPPNIGSLPFENQDSDLEDQPDPFNFEDPADDLLLHHSRRQNLQRARVERERERERDRDRDRDLAAGSQPPLDEAANNNATPQEAVRAANINGGGGGGGDQLLTPHARFYIEKRKSKCTIKFDPPVSGRFILLKMWSSQHDPESNIDIQSVIARGFAGPRYFPAVDLR